MLLSVVSCSLVFLRFAAARSSFYAQFRMVILPGWKASCFSCLLAAWGEKEMAKPTCVLAGESHGRRSLAGCSPWGCTESDTAEATSRQQQQQQLGSLKSSAGQDHDVIPTVAMSSQELNCSSSCLKIYCAKLLTILLRFNLT